MSSFLPVSFVNSKWYQRNTCNYLWTFGIFSRKLKNIKILDRLIYFQCLWNSLSKVSVKLTNESTITSKSRWSSQRKEKNEAVKVIFRIPWIKRKKKTDNCNYCDIKQLTIKEQLPVNMEFQLRLGPNVFQFFRYDQPPNEKYCLKHPKEAVLEELFH